MTMTSDSDLASPADFLEMGEILGNGSLEMISCFANMISAGEYTGKRQAGGIHV